MQLVQDIWSSEIFPQLDNISFLCLQAAFCHTKLEVDRCEKLLDEVVKHSPDFVQYFISQQLLTDTSEILLAAARSGNLQLIQVLQGFYPLINWPLIARKATKHGQLAIIKYIFDLEISMPIAYCLTEAAVEYDQLECLLFYLDTYSYDIDDLAQIATIHDSLHCLKHIVPRLHTSVPRHFLVSEAIYHNGSIECVKYLVEAFRLTSGELAELLGMVSEGITVQMLEYFVSIGVVLTVEHATNLALYNSNVNRGLFEFLHKLGLLSRITNPTVYRSAIQFPEVVQFLCSINQVLPTDACRIAVKRGAVESLYTLHSVGYTLNNCMISALKYCSAAIPYLVQHGEIIPENALRTAINNNIESLILLSRDYSQSIPNDVIQQFVETIDNESSNDNQRILRHLVGLGYKPSAQTLYTLIRTGSFECVIYGIVQKFPWDIQECFDYLDKLDVNDVYYLLVNKLLQNTLKYDTFSSAYKALLGSNNISQMLKELQSR